MRLKVLKKYYDQGVKNGLKDSLLYHDLKPNNNNWSYLGNKSTLEDWKKYFQANDKNYNTDVILLDGRFKVATAIDMFNKIKDDPLLFIHEYQGRQPYFVLENYYQYIYHWDSLVLFIKRKDISSIPIEVQKKY